MRIGNQTSFAAATLLQPFEFALANGFTAFEFFPDRGLGGPAAWEEQDVGVEVRRAISETARQGDLELSVHAPLEFNPLDDRSRSRGETALRFAEAIGATLVNLHLDLRAGIEQFADALAPVARRAAVAGLKVAVENTVWTGPEDFNRFFAALQSRREVPREAVGMTFDLGHANLHAGTRNDYCSYLDRLEPHVPILHLHLHENHGDRDSHLTLFTGPAGRDPAGVTGLLDRLARRGFNGCAILEQWPQPPSLLVQARDRLIELGRAQAPRGGGLAAGPRLPGPP
jgi:sugar phosphate isomerase/epimerase